MMAINGYRVINVFKTTNIYLLHPAKKIFRKFPKMDFLKNIYKKFKMADFSKWPFFKIANSRKNFVKISQIGHSVSRID